MGGEQDPAGSLPHIPALLPGVLSSPTTLQDPIYCTDIGDPALSPRLSIHLQLTCSQLAATVQPWEGSPVCLGPSQALAFCREDPHKVPHKVPSKRAPRGAPALLAFLL